MSAGVPDELYPPFPPRARDGRVWGLVTLLCGRRRCFDYPDRARQACSDLTKDGESHPEIGYAGGAFI